MTGRINAGAVVWLLLFAFLLACISQRNEAAWLITYPDNWVVPITPVLNAIMKWSVDNFGWFFRGVSWVLEWPIKGVQAALHWLPWTVVVLSAVQNRTMRAAL